MNDKLKAILQYAMIVSVLLCITAVPLFLLWKFSQPVTIYMGGYEVTPKSQTDGDIDDFVVLAKRFADNHYYNLSDYNCKNYTADLHEIANELGFKTSVIKGCPADVDKSTPCHLWLRLSVDFEPQSGYFTDYSGAYPIQEVSR